MKLTCCADPSKREDVWAHGHYQRPGLHVEGDRGGREPSIKETVRGTFHQFGVPKIDSIVNESPIV